MSSSSRRGLGRGRGRGRRPSWKLGAVSVIATGISLRLVFASFVFDGISVPSATEQNPEQNRTFSLRSSHGHRRLTHCEVSHDWIEDNGGCDTLCGTAACEPQGECCSCCGMGCEACTENGCNGVLDQCHICDGTGLNSQGCCPQVPDRTGCDNECGSRAEDLGCGCGSPGPDSCGVCGGSGPSGCDNMVCGIFPRFNPSVVFPPFQPQLSCTSRFNLSIICSLF